MAGNNNVAMPPAEPHGHEYVKNLLHTDGTVEGERAVGDGAVQLEKAVLLKVLDDT